jgi:hypothetical protein
VPSARFSVFRAGLIWRMTATKESARPRRAAVGAGGDPAAAPCEHAVAGAARST